MKRLWNFPAGLPSLPPGTMTAHALMADWYAAYVRRR